MDLGLAGKIAVVTGASKGIGLAITRSLVAEGARVAAGARSPGALAELDGVHPVTVDLTAPDGPARLVDEAVAAFGGIDILVNNVGSVHPPARRLPRHHRRRVGGDTDRQLPRGRSDHAGRAAAPNRRCPEHHCHRQLGQRLPP